MINRAAQGICQTLKLLPKNTQWFSEEREIINAPPEKYANNRQALKKNTWRDLDPTGFVDLSITRNRKPRI